MEAASLLQNRGGSESGPSSTDLVAQQYASFAVGDVFAFLDRLAPQVEWVEHIAPPHGGIFVGPDAVQSRVLDPLLSDWDGFRIDPEEMSNGGPFVVVTGRLSGKYRATGKRLAMPFCHVWKVEAGRVVQFKHFTDATLMEAVL